MASLCKDPNGRKRILFVTGDGSRKAIRLGKTSIKQAESFKIKMEIVRSLVGNVSKIILEFLLLMQYSPQTFKVLLRVRLMNMIWKRDVEKVDPNVILILIYSQG